MTRLPKNPPAFPVPEVRGDGMVAKDGAPGMTLRDWFAGQVLPAIVAATSAGQHSPLRHDERGEVATQLGMARDAYALADAMLAQREVV